MLRRHTREQPQISNSVPIEKASCFGFIPAESVLFFYPSSQTVIKTSPTFETELMKVFFHPNGFQFDRFYPFIIQHTSRIESRRAESHLPSEKKTEQNIEPWFVGVKKHQLPKNKCESEIKPQPGRKDCRGRNLYAL